MKQRKRAAKQSSKRPRSAAKRPARSNKTAKRGTPRKPAARSATRATRARSQPAKAKQPAKRTKRTTKKRTGRRAPSPARWVKFVEEHGVVLASARGPVPSVAEAIAGEPIVGSWWSHPRAQVIFDALCSIDDSVDVRCFKLVDHKITFVHRRRWPALARLAEAGVLEHERVASIQQEHMPTGEHRNFTMPYPDWVPDDVAAIASQLSVEDARAQLGAWL